VRALPCPPGRRPGRSSRHALTTNDTKVDLIEDGKGSTSPGLGSTIANDVKERCELPTPQPRLMEQGP